VFCTKNATKGVNKGRWTIIFFNFEARKIKVKCKPAIRKVF
jgi:hypothetical protein